MATAQTAFEPVDALLRAWATNNRIDVYLIGNVPEEAWRAKPPNGKGRDIASMFAHMHNVRLMWLKSVDKNAALPLKLEGETCSKEDAVSALRESAAALDAVLRKALSGTAESPVLSPVPGVFLLICWRMTRIIGDRSACWRGRWGIRFRRARGSGFGSGARGKNAAAIGINDNRNISLSLCPELFSVL